MNDARTYLLPLPPSANAYWQFGALRSRTGRARRVPLTKRASNFRQEVAFAVFEQSGRRMPEPMMGFIALDCRIVWPDRRRRDSGNLSKQLEDALEKCGLVPNDVWIVDRRYWVDRSVEPNGTGLVEVTLSILPAVETPKRGTTAPRRVKGGV